MSFKDTLKGLVIGGVLGGIGASGIFYLREPPDDDIRNGVITQKYDCVRYFLDMVFYRDFYPPEKYRNGVSDKVPDGPTYIVSYEAMHLAFIGRLEHMFKERHDTESPLLNKIVAQGKQEREFLKQNTCHGQ